MLAHIRRRITEAHSLGAALRIELLELDKTGVHVAEYLTSLPRKEVMQTKLQEAVALSRATRNAEGKTSLGQVSKAYRQANAGGALRSKLRVMQMTNLPRAPLSARLSASVVAAIFECLDGGNAYMGYGRPLAHQRSDL